MGSEEEAEFLKSFFREKGIRLRLEKWRIYDLGT